jgi:hypothetical protein
VSEELKELTRDLGVKWIKSDLGTTYLLSGRGFEAARASHGKSTEDDLRG